MATAANHGRLDGQQISFTSRQQMGGRIAADGQTYNSRSQTTEHAAADLGD